MRTKKEIWKIGIRKKTDPEEKFWELADYQFNIINLPARYWQADPFLFEKDGKTYLFYELWNWTIERGCIAYSVVEDGKVSKIKKVIKKKYHMSFPYIFEYNAKIYMIPEVGETESIKLFVAVSFPDKWEECKPLIQQIRGSDSIILSSNNEDFLLVSVLKNDNPGDIQNVLYILENNKLKKNHKGNVVAQGEYGIRNGGKPFVYKGKQIRVGQDCTNRTYGKGLVLWKIESISPYLEKEYRYISREEISEHIRKKKQYRVDGIHTYNATDAYEVIDILTHEELPWYIWCNRLVYRGYCYVMKKLQELLRRVFGKD